MLLKSDYTYYSSVEEGFSALSIFDLFLQSKQFVLAITEYPKQASILVDEVRNFTKNVALLPDLDEHYGLVSDLVLASRNAVFEGIFVGEPKIIVADVLAATRLIKDPNLTRLGLLKFCVGNHFFTDSFANSLISLGYERSDSLESPRQFRIKGNVIDVRDNLLTRIEVFDEKIESLSIITAEKTEKITEVSFAGDQKLLEKSENKFTLLDYFQSVIIATPINQKIEQRLQATDEREKFARVENFYASLKKFPRIIFASGEKGEKKDSISLRKMSSITYDILDTTQKTIENIFTKYKRLVILSKSIGRQEILKDLLVSKFEEYHSFEEALGKTDRLGILILDWKYAFTIGETVFIPENLLHQFPSKNEENGKKREKITAKNPIEALSSLKIGDLLVHSKYGVGEYLGTEISCDDGITNEFVVLGYAGEVRLFVPIDELSLVDKYIGVGTERKLDKIGSQKWQTAKENARKLARDVAVKILAIYAKRELQTRTPITINTADYEEFSKKFPYVETDDQMNAIADIIDDMSAKAPMERLICGDVGVGKTEVAIRAIYLAVNASRQVIFLVPTTLLCEQHYERLKQRFHEFPIRIERLSRMQKNSKETLANLEAGRIDILIATHRALSKDVKFNNLGLAVIDEEHKFGVEQKEELKRRYPNLDILLLSATPIPRTLHMAMSNVRDISLISTAPKERLAIKTIIVNSNYKETIKKAIEAEINRGGQVYYLYNNVENMPNKRDYLQELLPVANIAFANGQMKADELEAVMLDFYYKKYDVLICSTVIENGIDIPNVNTIIVEDAENFGLAQLHQIRGRVGRSHRQAYCYFLVSEFMTKDAKARLSTLVEHNELGAGFNIAMNDLEIRGSGQLLGSVQSGHIKNVSFNTYLNMIETAVEDIRSGSVEMEEVEPMKVELNRTAIIGNDYITDISRRIYYYQQANKCSRYKELFNLKSEMIDLYGKFGESEQNFFLANSIRISAMGLPITKIQFSEADIAISFAGISDDFLQKLLSIITKNNNLNLKPDRLVINNIASLTLTDQVKVLEDVLSHLKK